MKTEKKCPNCGAWVTWEKKPSDRCSNCGELLDSEAHKAVEKRAEKARIDFEKDFFRIRATDNILMKIVRKTAFVLHAMFAAITWAFLWFVSTFAG